MQQRATRPGYVTPLVLMLLLVLSIGLIGTSSAGSPPAEADAIAHAEMAVEDTGCYLPLVLNPPTATATPSATPEPTHTFTPTPSSTPTRMTFMLADFDDGSGINNVGGEIGSAFESPSWGEEKYTLETGRGRVATIHCGVDTWFALYMMMQKSDWSAYSSLLFDIHIEEGYQVPTLIKIDIKRDKGKEWSYTRTPLVAGSHAWHTISVPLDLDGFDAMRGYKPISSFDDIEELVFTLETPWAGPAGTIIFWDLDGVRLQG